MGMHRTILSSVARLILPSVSTLPNKWHDFRENVIEHKEVFFMFLHRIL